MQPWQYIVLLGAVVAVFAFIMPRKKMEESAPSSSSATMEKELEQFMDLMEKDNQELVQAVAKVKKQAEDETARKEQRIASLEQQSVMLSEQLQVLLQSQTAPNSQSVLQQPVLEEKQAGAAPVAEAPIKVSNSLQERYSELFQLYEQGKSIEAIAKKLAMNKGEIQLIIQLAKQEEAVRVQ